MRLPRLLDVRSVGIYLRQHGRFETAAAAEVTGPHSVVAERLLDLALGPFRARGFVASTDAGADRHLAGVRAAVQEAAIEAVHAVPLVAQGEVTGLLAVYPSHGRALTDDQSALLTALAAQIAVAVQNAGLHEDLKRQEAEQKRVREAEAVAARRLSALYEISRSFAHSLSLGETLDAIASTVVDLLEVDVAVIRVPDERGELLTQRVHVAGPQLAPSMQAVFEKPEHVIPSAARRRLVQGQAVRVDATTAAELGRSHGLLTPFLERGSTAAVVPIATPAELLATLTIVSLDPAKPLSDETLDTALFVAAQAALAVDNARLYQQQKAFTDSMQHSLLPRFRPQVAGLEIGAVYESSALVGVGGDVYDYLQTGDRRLAIVLGDVTGHGIDAAADMAMAKFVFRSLARLYPEPGAFLAAANDVVVEEIGAGKFITMQYLTVDAEIGEVAVASGGHPPPRLVHAEGEVEGLEAPGLVLGIESGQPYEELRRPFAPGDTVVLYTDGVVEARRNGELYGEERLDKLLGDKRDLTRAGDRRGGARGLSALGRRRPARRLCDRRRPASVNLRGGNGPLLIGHKGAGALEPENTLASLSRAVELGCDLVEFDVLEVEGRLVLGHSLPELAPDPATFDEALELLGASSVGLLVDLKWHGYEASTVEAIRRHGLVERVLVSSCHAHSVLEVARLAPELARGITYPYDRHGFSERRGLAPFDGCRADHPPHRAAGADRLAARPGGCLGCSALPRRHLPRSRRTGTRARCRRARLDGGRDGRPRAGDRGGRRRRRHKRPSHLPADALRSDAG